MQAATDWQQGARVMMEQQAYLSHSPPAGTGTCPAEQSTPVTQCTTDLIGRTEHPEDREGNAERSLVPFPTVLRYISP